MGETKMFDLTVLEREHLALGDEKGQARETKMFDLTVLEREHLALGDEKGQALYARAAELQQQAQAVAQQAAQVFHQTRAPVLESLRSRLGLDPKQEVAWLPEKGPHTAVSVKDLT